jgi:hypothetical protein
MIKNSILLTVMSLLALLFLTFHLADDVVRGFDAGGFNNITGIAIMVVWLVGALMLAGRVSGCIIMLIFGILGTLVPIIHMGGRGMVGGRIAGTNGMRFWVWTMLIIGATSAFSAILAVRELWNLRRSATGATASRTGRSSST